MKTPITVRIEPDLLAAVRHHAGQENRTLTNFIETVLRQKINSQPPSSRSAVPDQVMPMRKISDAG